MIVKKIALRLTVMGLDEVVMFMVRFVTWRMRVNRRACDRRLIAYMRWRDAAQEIKKEASRLVNEFQEAANGT